MRACECGSRELNPRNVGGHRLRDRRDIISARELNELVGNLTSSHPQ